MIDSTHFFDKEDKLIRQYLFFIIKEYIYFLNKNGYKGIFKKKKK